MCGLTGRAARHQHGGLPRSPPWREGGTRERSERKTTEIRETERNPRETRLTTRETREISGRERNHRGRPEGARERKTREGEKETHTMNDRRERRCPETPPCDSTPSSPQNNMADVDVLILCGWSGIIQQCFSLIETPH